MLSIWVMYQQPLSRKHTMETKHYVEAWKQAEHLQYHKYIV